MELIFYAQTSIVMQYFLAGVLGSIFFDATIFFNKDLGAIAKRKRGQKERVIKRKKMSKNAKFWYFLFQTIYSCALGGIIAIFINHTLWLAFIVGFFNSVFVTFVVKTILLNSTKEAFWIIIGKLTANILLAPSKRIVTLLEIFDEDKQGNKKD